MEIVKGPDHAAPGGTPTLAESMLTLVVFVVEGQRWALPVGSVERAVPMLALTPVPAAPAVVIGMINLHGQAIPVVDIRRRLALPPREYSVRAHLLIARSPRRRLALAADEVLGVREVAAASVIPPRALLPRIDHVAGVVAIDDGLLWIQDLDAFLSLEEEDRLSRALCEAPR